MISPEVRRFILTSIPSVPHLEALVLMLRDPVVEHGCAEVARALYVPEALAAEMLDYLCEIGFLGRAGAPQAVYRYAPRDEDARTMLEQVVAAYRSDMIAVTHLIHDTTQKSAQRFADAFKLKKER